MNDYAPEKVAVLLTAHPRQQMFWDECLPSWTDSPFYVILGYDDNDADKIMEPLKKYPGVKEVFCTGKRWGHVKGELTQFKMGFKIAREKKFLYTLKLAADYKVDHPLNIQQFAEALEKPVHPSSEGLIGSQLVHNGTAMLFGFSTILDSMMDWFNPSHTYGSAERYFSIVRRILNVTRAEFDPKDFWHFLGLTHVQDQYARSNKITIQDTWDIAEIWK